MPLPVIIALAWALFIFVSIGAFLYDTETSKKDKVLTAVIDCRHRHSGSQGGYVVTFVLGQKIIEHHHNTEYYVGDSIYVKYYYSKMNGKLRIYDIQKKYQ